MKTAALTLLLSLAPFSFGQQSGLTPRTAWVQQVPTPLVAVTRGKPDTVDLEFFVREGFHINSNKPHSDYLIPTALKLDPPTDIAIGKITYPAGEDMSFAFDPNSKLNVYTGDFVVNVQVHPLASVVPGNYAIRGELTYQACDDRACYPPKHLPVGFQVQVKKAAAATPKRNPRQSPNIHH
jgi:hypothetical protein